MKPLRTLLSLALLSLPVAAFAAAAPPVATPDAKASFESLKALEGAWEGQITTDPPVPEITGKTTKIWLRVTSMGNVLMHEMKTDGRPDDPITMLYLDEGRLLLTHYCDAGNRPRMVGTALPDGKTVDFEYLDVSGPTKYGHMHHAAFTAIDADHHSEDWTFMLAGDKHVRAHFDLHRVPAAAAPSK
jgi:hypothetical protein